MPWIDENECVGCGACIDSCPEGAILMENEKAAIDQDKCTFCGECFSACPQEAIRSNSKNPLLRGRTSRHSGGGGFGRGIQRGLGR